MFGRELVERRGDLPPQHRSFDRKTLGVLLVARLVQSQRGTHGGTPTRVDDRVPGDLVEPRADAAARGVVGLGVPPGAREDLLHDLLGAAAVAQRVEREAVQLARVGTIELAQRLAGGVRRYAGDELSVTGHGHQWVRAGPDPGSIRLTASIVARPVTAAPPMKTVGVVTTPARTPARQSAFT